MKTIDLQIGLAWQGEETLPGVGFIDFIPVGFSCLTYPARRLVYLYLFPGVLMLAWNITPKVKA